LKLFADEGVDGQAASVLAASIAARFLVAA
jgi:hypothetical protein